MLKKLLQRVTFRHHRDDETKAGWHGRVWSRLWDRPVHGEHYDDHAQHLATLAAEYHLPGRHVSVGLVVHPDEEHAFTLSLCAGVADLYVGLEGRWAASLAQRLIDRFNDLSPVYGRNEGRRTSIRFFDWGVWWDLWYPESSGRNGDPRWRSGSWHPFGRRMCRYEDVGRPVRIRMPRIEGDPEVFGTAQEQRWESYSDRWPWLVLERGRCWDINLDSGYRGSHGFSGGIRAGSLGKTVGMLIGYVLERNGGLVVHEENAREASA